MEKQQIIFYRPPPEAADQQIYILNSTINYRDKRIVFYHRSNDQGMPRSYCVVFKRDHCIHTSHPNYESPTKRSFLNECLRQIYLMNGWGHKILWPIDQTFATRHEIWQQVDRCLVPTYLPDCVQMLQRVKRQLFRKAQYRRKTNSPARNKKWGTQVFYFRPLRRHIYRMHICRDFMKYARQLAIEEIIRENIKRQHTQASVYRFKSYSLPYNNFNSMDGIYNVNAQLLAEICQYHQDNAHHQHAVERNLNTKEARVRYHNGCKLMVRAKRLEAMFIHEQVLRICQRHQIIKQEEARATFCRKELASLIEDHDKFVKLDKCILARNTTIVNK